MFSDITCFWCHYNVLYKAIFYFQCQSLISFFWLHIQRTLCSCCCPVTPPVLVSVICYQPPICSISPNQAFVCFVTSFKMGIKRQRGYNTRVSFIYCALCSHSSFFSPSVILDLFSIYEHNSISQKHASDAVHSSALHLYYNPVIIIDFLFYLYFLWVGND